MKLPIRPVTLPSALAGQRNGRLAPSLLVPILGGRLEQTTARAWNAMSAAAAADGIELRPTSSADTFRSYDRQLSLFLSRYTPSYNPTVNVLTGTRTFEGKRWWRRRGVAPAATPGTSNHGWGLAIDVASSSGARLDWMLANAARFGFSWELQSEPWHLRYVEGDTVPPAVLAFENGTEPAPATSDPYPALRQGDRGDAVKRMQERLMAHGVAVRGGADGVFGPVTRGAVVSFQRQHNLTVDGVVGPQTWGALNADPVAPTPEPAPAPAPEPAPAPAPEPAPEYRPVLRRGAKGDAVRRMQSLLNNHHIRCYVDGDFGPKTWQAVRQFQATHQLKVDGWVGPQTWNALTKDPCC